MDAKPQWAPVPGYEGLYEVSTSGAVRSLPRSGARGGILRPASLRRSGHLRVVLSKGGQQKSYLVHRLVLGAFVGPCPPGMEARHLNDVSTDNDLSNLCWGTPSENQFDRVRNGRSSQANRTHCPRGHELKAPNLTASDMRRGYRSCLACSRGYRRGVLDVPTADAAYQKILAETAQD